jgi:hypothetical protein
MSDNINFVVEDGILIWDANNGCRAATCPEKAMWNEIERLKAFIADKIHDATRERMLMEVEGE